jgi:hypothetical protein
MLTDKDVHSSLGDLSLVEEYRSKGARGWPRASPAEHASPLDMPLRLRLRAIRSASADHAYSPIGGHHGNEPPAVRTAHVCTASLTIDRQCNRIRGRVWAA